MYFYGFTLKFSHLCGNDRGYWLPRYYRYPHCRAILLMGMGVIVLRGWVGMEIKLMGMSEISVPVQLSSIVREKGRGAREASSFMTTVEKWIVRSVVGFKSR